GGGIIGSGTWLIEDRTISSNSANASNAGTGHGGGAFFVFGWGNATIRNCTISGNSAASGGGLALGGLGSGILDVQNSTLTSNSAAYAGGGFYTFNPGTTFTSRIISGNSAGTSPDADGKLAANYSLFGNSSGAMIIGSNNKLNI